MKLIAAFLTALFLCSACIPVFAQSEEETLPAYSAREILLRATSEDSVYTIRKFDFLRRLLRRASTDTTGDLDFVFNSDLRLFLTPEELQEIPMQPTDPSAEEFRRRYLDIPPTTPVNGLLQAIFNSFRKKTPKTVQELPIPKDVEIDVLKVLWNEGLASSSDIYSELDSLTGITSEILNGILEQMTERGFVERKKISAAHEFNLFGVANIEMSELNRKNQLYVYWPVVSKQKLIAYLDAQRYLAFTAAQKESTDGSTNLRLKYLIFKLNRISKQP